ncbi:phenylalanine ammonia-lyase [Fusarium oxysporum f. sp. raphani 54005]|uniref:Phenylalanine ammonia-lyase n=3 Tax=Fusarium oxysporum TaxID=5507 RepID=X0C398_FUSOX|nr:phenylalanine ammonia-lyase [Fusarium oxysporum f. sp. melonis 26406]EXK85638.1 phenylalanine ammonia-lyase [Fusarium oxysporum f. sp. raphani 54005]KAG7426447.1 Phenylalanine aminomutase [Fusarium oxysporum f. sp. raphani]
MPLRDTDHLFACGHHVTAVSDRNCDSSRSTKPSESSSHSSTHASQACDIWKKIQSIKDCGFILLDGSDLDVASVIAVAKYNCNAYVAKRDDIADAMNKSVVLLEEYLAKGYFVYGVNTGFGGSADTRTKDLPALQSALLQLTQAGILTDEDNGLNSMPVTWVRAAMLIRCNTLLRGHSGVRLELVQALLLLLRKGMTPIVPLRGSISASGDLIPLSYIAGMLEGNPDIRVHTSTSFVLSAGKALELAGLEPITLGPKEGLGLVNGTAPSAALGCLAVHEANKILLLAQGLVAMSCEALLGKAENYHPFISSVCPHPGQVECSETILHFLGGSSLVQSLKEEDKFKPGLAQDRYALRGAPQWLGPQVEDVRSVLSQITVELNSTSDNPIIDIKSGEVYSGANFISSSVANGMEKSRLALQMVGKLLFSLSSELINPTMNRGLPPNLVADDPSLSFTMKGIDISMAAYLSELGYLANPVTPHVQSAEMHNQSINSLALISGRYTLQAADVVTQMCAAHLFAVCQALDLRVLHMTYLQALRSKLSSVVQPFLGGVDDQVAKGIYESLHETIVKSWNASACFDLQDRCKILSRETVPVLCEHLEEHEMHLVSTRPLQRDLENLAYSTFTQTRSEFFIKPPTKQFLGRASLSLYSFVREELGVPFHQGLVEHPGRSVGGKINRREKRTIGSWVSIIYTALTNDHVWGPLVEALGSKTCSMRPV